MRIVLLFLSFVSAGWAKGIPDDVGIKILNGTEAYPGQFPYMAAIYANGFYQCGGALVDPSWILTDWDFARIPGAQVALGLHDFDNFENGGQVEVYDIEQIVQEPSGLSFLALVKLSRPVASGNPYIQTIALAPQDDYNYVGGNCYICGWGQTESVWSGGVLRYVQADVVSEDDCLVEMLDTPTEICVADSNTGLCNLDGPKASLMMWASRSSMAQMSILDSFLTWLLFKGSQVVLGLHDFDDFENGGRPEVYNIVQSVQEPSGNSDIALLKLSRPVAPGNPYIQTIALAPQDGHDYVGGNCYYCGWGFTETRGPGGLLQYAQANVVTDDDCPDGSLNSATEICVVDTRTGTCNRDYGGPLACRRDGLTYLVGTLKYHSSCGNPWRSLFHKMSYYSDWIRAVIG